MKTSKVLLASGLTALGVLMVSAPSVSSAFSPYTIGVPKTTKSSKPNGKDLAHPERVSHPSNKFASHLETSGEGEGTYTTMWMELRYGTINTASGAKTRQSYDKNEFYLSKHKNAGLTAGTWHNVAAENNNFSAGSYTITGTWSADNS